MLLVSVVEVVFQTLLSRVFILLRYEMKALTCEQLPEQPAGVLRAVGQDMLGQPNERQLFGFRAAYEPCVDSLGVEGEESGCVCQVLQVDVAERRRREENRCSTLYWRLILLPTSRDVTQDDGRKF